MNYPKVIVPLFTAALFAGLAGCGSDNRETSSTASLQKSQACIGCHSAKTSPVTGNLITQEWLNSAHNTRNGAACPDCHKPTGHPNGGIITNPLDAVCLECHTQATMKTGAAHFDGSVSFNATKAAYVTPNDANGCRVCHNPHDMTSLININKQWAESKHGLTTEPAWADSTHKWKAPANSACQRCHTETGYVYYMTNGLKIPGSTFFGQYTTGREVAGCKTCHIDYSWKRRTSDASFATFSTPYKTPSGIPRTYATNLGDSRLCIPCHSGRESGESVKAIADFTNVSFKNSHYLGAAGSFYQKIGYHFYTSATKMTNTWQHSNIGVNNYVTSAGIATGSNGPCVACHMNGLHTWDPIEVAKSTGATGCYGCHGTDDMALLNEEERTIFERGMDFFAFTLNNGNIFYSTVYPYFYTTAAATTAVKNWTVVGPTSDGSRNMGAAFNFNMLTREKGAHVHNRTYARRLIFDSIQYLQTGTNTYSTSTGTIGGTTDPNAQVSFTAYSTAVAAGTRPANATSITALKGWLLRSSGGKYYRR